MNEGTGEPKVTHGGHGDGVTPRTAAYRPLPSSPAASLASRGDSPREA